jgi:hypothetical protein
MDGNLSLFIVLVLYLLDGRRHLLLGTPLLSYNPFLVILLVLEMTLGGFVLVEVEILLEV